MKNTDGLSRHNFSEYSNTLNIFLLCWLQWGQGSGYDFHFRTPLNQLKIFKTVLTAICRTTDIWLNLYQLNNQTVIPGCYYSSKLPMKTLEQVLKSIQS